MEQYLAAEETKAGCSSRSCKLCLGIVGQTDDDC